MSYGNFTYCKYSSQYSSRLGPEPLPYLRGTQQTPKRNVILALSHRGAITPILVRTIVKSCRSCFFFAPWCDDADGCNNADGCAGPHDYGNLESTTDRYLPESRRRAVIEGHKKGRKKGQVGRERTYTRRDCSCEIYVVSKLQAVSAKCR